MRYELDEKTKIELGKELEECIKIQKKIDLEMRDLIDQSIMQFICDELCRHPRECDTQEQLDEICDKCSFGRECK